MTDALRAFIESKGFHIPEEEIIFDDTWRTSECKLTHSKIRHVGVKNVEGKIRFTFGPWADTSTNFTYNPDKVKETKEQKALREKETLERYEIAAKIAEYKYIENAWGEGKLGDTYLSRKWPLPLLPNVDIAWSPDTNGEAMLKLPMKDVDGRMWNIQFIQTDGTKRNISGAKGKGLFLKVDAWEKPPTEIYLCEGFATALTVATAMKSRAFCCFGASNIPHVLTELRKAKVIANFIVILDNDHEKKINAGEKMKANLKKKFGGIRIVMPSEMVLGPKISDYNDVMLFSGPELGLKNVKDDIEKQLGDLLNNTAMGGLVNEAPKPTAISETRHFIQEYVNGLAPMPTRFHPTTGKPIMPEEAEVANYVMQYYKGRIVRSQDSFFIYKDTHWVEVDGDTRAYIFQQIMVSYNGLGGARKFESTLKIFMNLVTPSPRNMFIQNPYIVNLKNGTIHILKEETTKKWRFEFKKHSKLDFTVNTIPIDFDETSSLRNSKFEDMVQRLLGGDLDKIRIVKQMYGACLAPMFPRLFMLMGPKGSGKSSLIMGAIKLVDAANVARVQPCDMEHPHLETMIGKLVNVVTDIDIVKPIQDSVIKQIEDRVPIAINRKFKAVVNAPIPAVHVFGGNEMPPNRDRGSQAHTRRWSFVKVNSFKAEETAYTRDFVAEVFSECPGGVLNFALEGLKDLLESNGIYFASKDSLRLINDWQETNDIVSLFIKACKEHECDSLIWEDGAWLLRSEVWRKYSEWHKDYFQRPSSISRNKLFSALEKQGALFRVYQGARQFSNFRLKNEEEQKNPKSKNEVQRTAPAVQAGCNDLLY